MLQKCHFMTNFTAVAVANSILPEINLRMSQSSFAVNTSDKNTKIIYFATTPKVSWMLLETKFQLNSYSTMSSDKNFAKNLDKIVTIHPNQTFPGTISETQYASGNDCKRIFLFYTDYLTLVNLVDNFFCLICLISILCKFFV